MAGEGTARGRLLTGVAWAVLLLGLWLWGRESTDGPHPHSAPGPMAGDAAGFGHVPGAPLPPPRAPLDGNPEPRRVLVPSLGVAAPVERRGLDAGGAVDPPPYERPGSVGWYADGTAPGGAGAALLVGHVDTATRPAVFHGLGSVEPGAVVRVERADGVVAEFTVEDVRLIGRDAFDADRVYGPRRPGRAELRLITCGGEYDRASREYSANLVVSAYLTGADRPA